MARPPEKRNGAGPSTRQGSGKKSDGFRGLPPLEEPIVEPGHRVVLIACSKTGRASWADLEPLANYEGGFRWVGNLTAVPDLKAIRGEERKGTKRAGGGASGSGNVGGGTLKEGSLYWGGYHCGVCECSSCPVPGHEDSIFWQCNACQTLYCSGGFERTGEDAWYLTCPGCGSLFVLEAHAEIGTISEYQSNTGRKAGSEGRRLTGKGRSDSRRQLGGGTERR